MSIRAKLLTAFAVSIIVTVSSCLSIFMQLRGIEQQYSNTLDTTLPETYATAELSRLTMAQATLVQNYILGKDTQEPIQGRRAEVLTLIDQLEESVEPEQVKAQTLLVSINEKVKIMNDSFDEAIQIKDTKGLEQAAQYYIDVAGMNVITFMDDATALTSEISTTFAQAQQDAKGQMNRAMVIAIIAILVAILTGVIASLTLKRNIAMPLHKLERHVREIFKGNLTVEPIQIDSKDEIGHLSEAINEMQDTLRTLLLSLSDNASHLSSTSEQLTASADEVSSAATIMLEGAKAGAESSVATAEVSRESAVAMDETATAIQKIVESSQQLHKFAYQTEQLAATGSTSIHTASDQMKSIYESTKLTTELIQKLSEQSREIEDITKVITGIADQTNLLSLNASIEAARAGEHGKGFAVVADEVRKLAEESNQSASKIVMLINEIQRDTKNVEQAIEQSLNNVEQGVGIITDTGHSFEEIVGAIGHMKEQIEDVSAVTEQISATAEEVAASVSEIARSSQATSDNASQSFIATEKQQGTLQEVAAVANDLSARAQELQQTVLKYKI